VILCDYLIKKSDEKVKGKINDFSIDYQFKKVKINIEENPERPNSSFPFECKNTINDYYNSFLYLKESLFVIDDFTGFNSIQKFIFDNKHYKNETLLIGYCSNELSISKELVKKEYEDLTILNDNKWNDSMPYLLLNGSYPLSKLQIKYGIERMINHLELNYEWDLLPPSSDDGSSFEFNSKTNEWFSKALFNTKGNVIKLPYKVKLEDLIHSGEGYDIRIISKSEFEIKKDDKKITSLIVEIIWDNKNYKTIREYMNFWLNKTLQLLLKERSEKLKYFECKNRLQSDIYFNKTDEKTGTRIFFDENLEEKIKRIKYDYDNNLSLLDITIKDFESEKILNNDNIYKLDSVRDILLNKIKYFL